MKVYKNNACPQKFTPVVDSLITKIESILPDRIDDLSIYTWIDLYEQMEGLKLVLSLCMKGNTLTGKKVHFEKHITFPCYISEFCNTPEGTDALMSAIHPILISELLQIVALSKTGSFVYKNGVVGNELEDLFTTSRGV